MANTLRYDGVKGMKLGVTKSVVDSSKTISTELKTNLGKSHSNTKHVKSMSDQDLRERVSRLNLEKQYSTLTVEQGSKGKKVAMKVLEVAGSVLTVAGSVLSIAQL